MRWEQSRIVIDEIVTKVIRVSWSNGYEPDVVQRRVNEMLK